MTSKFIICLLRPSYHLQLPPGCSQSHLILKTAAPHVNSSSDLLCKTQDLPTPPIITAHRQIYCVSLGQLLNFSGPLFISSRLSGQHRPKLVEQQGELKEAREANTDHNASRIVGIQNPITIIITTFMPYLQPREFSMTIFASCKILFGFALMWMDLQSVIHTA